MAKIGLPSPSIGLPEAVDQNILSALLRLMAVTEVDFSNFFRKLSTIATECSNWTQYSIENRISRIQTVVDDGHGSSGPSGHGRSRVSDEWLKWFDG
jgi:hypothetical protein